MRAPHWKNLERVNWKAEAHKVYVSQLEFNRIKDNLFATGHLSETFNDRNEWLNPNVFAFERRGYWDHLYIGGEDGVQHIISNNFDDAQNAEAAKRGYIEDTGRRANTIEQRIFKELNGVSERQAFGYSEPDLNKCVPKQLYYVNRRYLNKKIASAGKADYCSHYPAHLCGPLPTWDKLKVIRGRQDPTAEYPFAFYTRSGHCAEYKRFDTHSWKEEDISGDLFGNNYTNIADDKDVTVLCKEAAYRLDDTIALLYNKKAADETIDGMPAKTILVSSIGYKHLRSENNTKNRLYHLAAICIARANQTMIDLYNTMYKSVLQIVVDSIIYLGGREIGEHTKRLGSLHQELTDKTFIMRGVNQYMFIDRLTGQCKQVAHSGFDSNIKTAVLEDIWKWQRSQKEL